MDSVILENVTYRYPTSDNNILQNVSFSVKKGELYSIIGANGSGKTTICNVIRGFVPKFYKGDLSGKVIINGKSVEESTIGDLSLDIGFIFQNPFTQITGIADTVYEEIAYGLENLGIDPEEIKNKVEDVIKLTKLEELRDRNPYELSGGQQQRVAIASIIVMDQDILVIDEPTSQLDPQSTDDVFDLIKHMKKMGKTIILVEHKMEQVFQYSDHIAVMDEGKIVIEGTPLEVITNPDSEKYHLRLPQCTKIWNQLKERNIQLNQVPIYNQELVDSINEYMNTRKGSD